MQNCPSKHLVVSLKFIYILFIAILKELIHTVLQNKYTDNHTATIIQVNNLLKDEILNETDPKDTKND